MARRNLIYLIDLNPHLVSAWKLVFAPFPEVTVEHGDILNLAHNTIVSPANSYGIMDGGIDERYIQYFGPQIQGRLQAAIRRRPEGKLPVGVAILIKTGDGRIPYMISAPTMELPMIVPPANVFFAFSAVLKVAEMNKDRISHIYCPGLATGTGRVSPEDCAEEMVKAYGKWRVQNQST